MDGFYSHLREIAIISFLVILAGLTTTGYLINNQELAKWAQSGFTGLSAYYFGHYMGGKAANNANTDAMNSSSTVTSTYSDIVDTTTKPTDSNKIEDAKKDNK